MVPMNELLVEIQCGRVLGLASQILDKKVLSFRNLPYGKPPIGSKRFMPPEPAAPWDGFLDCTQPTNYPMQNIRDSSEMQHFTPFVGDLTNARARMSEDCLRLSIYTPANFSNGKHPVMVWFYGGSFQMGAANMYDGSILTAKHDVVVVVPNYRVGVFGFFSLGVDSPCTGNAGLFDQHLALQWVQNNIESFGGDPNNVTIFGESAGGISVNHHVNSSLSTGLFHKAISHSGQASLAKLYKRDLSRARENFLDILNVREREPSKLLQILQELPAKEIARADREMLTRYMAFDPTFDGIFIHKPPSRSLIDGPVNKVPYIIGCNDSEGHGMLTLLARIPHFETGLTEDSTKVLITNFLPRMSPSALERCQQACIDFYVQDASDEFRFSKAYGNVYRDSMFVSPAVKTAEALVNLGCPIYFYYGRFQLRMNHDASYGPRVGKKPDWCHCDHSDDIFMMWGAPFAPERLSGGARFFEDEMILSDRCMKYITNFAKTGNPNVGHPVDINWPMYASGRTYLELHDNMAISSDLLPESVRFWTHTIFDIANRSHQVELSKL